MEDKELLLNDIYREIAEKTNVETARTIHQMFRGQQISFPLRFFHPDSIKEQICEEYDGTNVRELAIKFEYSEKSIRRIIKEQKIKERGQ